jgi:hypothetical protein
MGPCYSISTQQAAQRARAAHFFWNFFDSPALRWLTGHKKVVELAKPSGMTYP